MRFRKRRSRSIGSARSPEILVVAPFQHRTVGSGVRARDPLEPVSHPARVAGAVLKLLVRVAEVQTDRLVGGREGVALLPQSAPLVLDPGGARFPPHALQAWLEAAGIRLEGLGRE